MYTIEKLRLQKFEEVAIPKGKDIFSKVGARIPSIDMYGGEEAPTENRDKLGQLHAAENLILDEMEAHEEAKREAEKQEKK